MPIILTAILETLLYLLSVPLCAAFTLSISDGLRYGMGVSVFESRPALRKARAFRPIRKRRKRGTKSPWRVVSRLRGARVRLTGRLGLGDAAATALACGALRALDGRRVTVDITPVFSDGGLCLELTGMIRLRTGQIMTAMAMSQFENIRRRIARWTDTRLKA